VVERDTVTSRPSTRAGQEDHCPEAGNRSMNCSRYHCLMLFSAAQKEELQVFKEVLGIPHAEVTVSQKQKLEEIKYSRSFCAGKLIKLVL